MIVMKFGGSSVEDAPSIRRVISIIESRLDRRPVVVVSAIGKTTDRLVEIAELAAAGHRSLAGERVEALRNLHTAIVLELAGNENPAGVLEVVNHLFDELQEIARGLSVLQELTPRTRDAVLSYGERLSSQILTAALNWHGVQAVHIDARELIVTDRNFTRATPLFEETYKRLRQRIPPLAREAVVVLGGFIGSTPEGITTTLGRGGSDYTASLVGVGIDAEEVEIWTDVDGILTCDPSIIPEAHRIRVISFAEAAELAYFGARVLHPATMQPAMQKHIQVRVLNSRRPWVEGTLIVPSVPLCKNPVKAISAKRDITVITVESLRMINAYGFLKKIFEVFERYETPVDMVSTSEVSVSATIDDPTHLEEIVEDLEKFSTVTVESDQAIVCLVGDNIRYTPGIAARAFGALRDINVRMISQGASLLNLSFVVRNQDLEKAARKLHDEFFQQLDPEVFVPYEASDRRVREDGAPHRAVSP